MAKHRGLYKRGRIWWIAYAGPDGRIRRQSTGKTDMREAEKKLVQCKNEVQDGKDPQAASRMKKYLFSELQGPYLQRCERQRSYQTKEIFMRQLVAEFGNIPLRDFNTRLVEEWQSRRLKINKPSTVNRLLATLQHSLQKAFEWEMVHEEALKKVRKVKLVPENNRRLRYLTHEEGKALIGICASMPRLSHLRPILITALNTGMRREEILSLRWDRHIDLTNGFILLDKTKNGDRREIPINRPLKEALQGIERRLDSPYVFRDSQGRRYYSVRNALGTALKKVEIELCLGCNHERQKTEGRTPGPCPLCGEAMRRRKGIEDFHFHDLRHTFASHLVMAGIDLTTVKELLGHRTLTMTLRYSHLAPAHKVKALDVLEKVRNATAQKLHNPEKKDLTVNG